MGTGARQRRIIYQWRFKRRKRDDHTITAMGERAEKIADPTWLTLVSSGSAFDGLEGGLEVGR